MSEALVGSVPAHALRRPTLYAGPHQRQSSNGTQAAARVSSSPAPTSLP